MAKTDYIFNQEEFAFPEVGPQGEEKFFSYADGSDALANHGYVIKIKHVPTQKTMLFKAFITTFNDTYSQDWNADPVYGRADPLYMFKQTNRKISMGFKMIASSAGEAYENLAKAQMLAQFMYPNYTDLEGAKTISQGPLLRVQIMNLLQKTGKAPDTGDSSKNVNLYNSYPNQTGDGMLGFFADVTFDYNLESDEIGVFQRNGSILPKQINVNIGNFSPIHEQHLGWNESNNFGNGQNNFPYGAAASENRYNLPDIGPVLVPLSRSAPAYSKEELTKDEKAQAEAAIANAQARYGGMFGNMRKKRDARRVKDGKYSDSKAAYVQSALAGQEAIEQNYMKDGLSQEEYGKMFDGKYDFVE